MKINWIDQDSYSQGEHRHRFRAQLFTEDLSWDGNQNIPSNAVEFSAWFSGLLAEVPAEWRDKVVLSLVGRECDECSTHRAEFDLSLERPETDDEYTVRRAKEMDKERREAEEKAIAKEKAERSAYERLKAKYEVNP